MSVNLRRLPIRTTCQIYLFGRSFVFFTYSKVDATTDVTFGPVRYRGSFGVEHSPAVWIAFDDTEALVGAVRSALAAPVKTMSSGEYERLLGAGNPVVRELKLRSWQEVGRTTFLFNVNDYGTWLEVTRWPWRRGQFEGWPAWEKVVRVAPSRDRALKRLILAVQRQFVPRGFEFSPSRGLVPEAPRNPWPRPAVKQRMRTKQRHA